MPDKTIKVPRQLHRTALIAREDITDNKIRLSISSDEPYLRYDWMDDSEYFEVLDHSPGAIKDERLKAGMPLLFNHTRDMVLGRSEGYECDGHKIWVTAVLSTADDVKSHVQKVREGCLRDSSIGYEIIGDGKKIGTKDGIPIYAFPFRIFESSIVSIPADITVGIGRQRDKTPETELREISIVDEINVANSDKVAHTETSPKPTRSMEPIQTAPSPAPEINVVKERTAGVADYKARCKKIDEWVAALNNEGWRAKAAVIANKHKELDEPNYDAFRTEALNVCTTELSLDTPTRDEHRIQVIGERNGDPRQLRLSAGAQLVRSKEFIERAPQTGRRRSITIETDVSVIGIRGKVELAQRAGFNSSDLATINVAPMTQLLGLGMQPLRISDLISPGTTSAAAIPYPKENSQGTLDGVAVVGGMPRAGMTGERGVKPTWEPDITTDVANVKKIAVVTKVPDEFLSDFPGFQSFIDARLPAMVDNKAEEQMLYGDGVGNNIKGILTNAGILTRAYATDWFTTIRKAITDVEVTSFFTVDGIAMHPYDWEVASLEKDLNGQPLAGGPFYIPYGNGLFVEMRTFWGKPVATTVAVAVGRPVIGSWKLGAQYFLREGMRLETTNANEDDFKKNLIAIRAEERLALATYRPNCFLEVTGGPART